MSEETRGLPKPLSCAHCGETNSARGFVEIVRAVTLGDAYVKPGDTVSIDCIERLRPDVLIPPTTTYTCRAT